MKKSKNFHQPCRYGKIASAVQITLLLAGVSGLAGHAQAALSIAQSPAVDKTAAEPPPNVIISLDNSGSMDTVDTPDANGKLIDRMTAMKAAIRDAFNNVELNKFRLAYQGMNNGRGCPDYYCKGFPASVSSERYDRNMHLFDATTRTGFLYWVNGLQPYGGTPAHPLFGAVKSYLSKSTSDSYPNYNPWNDSDKLGQVQSSGQLTCRKNYHIFMTDGAWNDGTNNYAADYAQFDAKSHLLPDGKTYSPYSTSLETRVYKGSTGQIPSLSDMTLAQWATDLRPDMTNNVKDYYAVETEETVTSGAKSQVLTPYWNPKNNPATWQHIQTYTIGFGAAANLSNFDGMYGANYQKLVTDNGYSWPAIEQSFNAWTSEDSLSGHIYDLWHAAYNGRGKFYPVRTQTALRAAFEDILKNIEQQTSGAGTASAAATNSRLTQGATVYVAGFNVKASNWTGSLKAMPADDITGTARWTATIPAAGSRAILTSKDGAGIAFNWSSLTNGLTAGQIAALNLGADTTAVVDPVRAQPLRDIVNSQLAYVGAASGVGNAYSSYRYFAATVKDRPQRAYVGANDGMLHGFDAGAGTAASPGTGAEAFAYIPRGLVTSLRTLTNSSAEHRFWVDGSPFAGDAQIASPTGESGAGQLNGWRTVLVGALGAGGKGFFALDVTSPADLTEANAASKVLLDTTDSTDPDIGNQFNAPVMPVYASAVGNISTQITQINLPSALGGVSKQWAVIMGNGYNSTNGHPVLLIQSLEGVKTLYKVDACKLKSSDSTNTNLANCNPSAAAGTNPVTAQVDNGLSAPRAIDVDGNGTADFVYAGDLQGNVWKFDISSADSAQWGLATWSAAANAGKPLFKAQGPNGKVQAITSAPAVVAHPKGGLMVLVGTGRNIEAADRSDTKLNSFYGLWDKQVITYATATASNSDGSSTTSVQGVALGAGNPIGGFVSAPAAGAPRYSTLVQQDQGALSSGSTNGVSSGSTSSKAFDASKLGWYFDIPERQNGNAAKVLLNPVVLRDNVVRFISTNVANDSTGGSVPESCTPITASTEASVINFLDIFSGKNPNISIYLKSTTQTCTNGTCVPDPDPKITCTGSNCTPPDRVKLDGTDKFVDDGDCVKAIGTGKSCKIQYGSRPGREVGWRIIK